MAGLPAEFEASLNVRTLAPAIHPPQGCPPQCAEPLQDRGQATDSAALRGPEGQSGMIIGSPS